MAVKKEAVRPETTVAIEKEPEEKYEIRLFKDNNKYKDDVFVGVNGKGYLIKRGQTVLVPASVKEVLENSMQQDEYTTMLIEAQASAYEEEARRRNI